jgi:RNA polymerase sigma-70 factor (ECF subfamily)
LDGFCFPGWPFVALDFLGGYTFQPLEGYVKFFSFDDSYLQRLRGGDFPTEQHFVDYFGQLLLIKLRSRLRSSQTVDDIRQETFVRVLKAVRTGSVRSAEGLGSFVNSICNNVLQEHYRSSARSVPHDDAPLDPPDTSIDLDGMLVAKQTREQVRHTLSMLSEKDRRLLRAMFFEEKNKDEICSEFGVDRDYLRVLLHRAKQSFRTLYEQAEQRKQVSAG